MGTNVHCQGTSLDEALSAAWGHTGVRTFICMNPIMPLEIRLSVEALEYQGQLYAQAAAARPKVVVLYYMFANRIGTAWH